MSGTGSGYVWDDEPCPMAGCGGELQQQDRFNVMCLSCETVWAHYKDQEKHQLVRDDMQFTAEIPRNSHSVDTRTEQ